MARKEIKIFMDSKEVSNFLKVIDWSWLFTFLNERYNVSLSPRKELKELHDGAAIIKVEWPDELIEKCGMMADVFSSVKLATFDSCFKQVVEYDEDKFNEEREAWLSHPTKIFSYLDCDGTVKERTLALNIWQTLSPKPFELPHLRLFLSKEPMVISPKCGESKTTSRKAM